MFAGTLPQNPGPPSTTEWQASHTYPHASRQAGITAPAEPTVPRDTQQEHRSVESRPPLPRAEMHDAEAPVVAVAPAQQTFWMAQDPNQSAMDAIGINPLMTVYVPEPDSLSTAQSAGHVGSTESTQQAQYPAKTGNHATESGDVKLPAPDMNIQVLGPICDVCPLDSICRLLCFQAAEGEILSSDIHAACRGVYHLRPQMQHNNNSHWWTRPHQ